jgi:tetratricopeptide (TPR) repeat protein
VQARAGQFERAVADARRTIAAFPRALPIVHLTLGLALLADGHRQGARDVYAELDKPAPALAASANADLALGEGRLRQARLILDQGLERDLKEGWHADVEHKRLMLAQLLLRTGDRDGARAAAGLVRDNLVHVFDAALVQIGAGETAAALASAKRLAREIAPRRRAMAQLIEAEVLRVRGEPAQAIAKIQDALKLADTVVAHYLLARAALDAKLFAVGYSELQACLARRGEEMIAFGNRPGYRFAPPLTYYVARAQEGLGSADAKQTYKAFLAMMSDADADDPLVVDARRRAQ